MFYYAILHYEENLAWNLIVAQFSSSWGPDDDGHTVDGPHPLGKVRKRTIVWMLSCRRQCTATDRLQQ